MDGKRIEEKSISRWLLDVPADAWNHMEDLRRECRLLRSQVEALQEQARLANVELAVHERAHFVRPIIDPRLFQPIKFVRLDDDVYVESDGCVYITTTFDLIEYCKALDGDPGFICYECKRTFNSLFAWQQHKRDKHSEERVAR